MKPAAAIYGKSLASPEVWANLKRYISLLKVRPMSAVIYAAVIGLIAARADTSVLQGVIAIVCIAAGGGGSAALNMWYEADLDSRMARTSGRVLPSGRLKARRALFLGTGLCAASLVLMGLSSGWFAAGMLGATIFAYFGLYTVMLKRHSWLNVVIGATAAGVLTPLTGWAGAANELPVTAGLMFLFVLFWTPPHVWSQAMFRSADYARAGVPMLPVSHGMRATQRAIVLLTVAHSIAALLPWWAGDVSAFYALAAGVAGAALSWKALQLLRRREHQGIMESARLFFRYSIWYVIFVLTCLGLDRVIFF